MATEVLADEQTLRLARRQRALSAMDAHGIDALLLGREANARYVAGAPRLWTAGTRPYGPGCVVVGSTGAIHLVSTWDEGIPQDIPHENLFGITWNPGNLLAWLQGIEGLAAARRIGTDSLTPRFAQLLPKIFPTAELVDAEPALEAARRVKTPEEIAVIRTAVSVAEDSLAAAVAELRPGVSERHLAGVFMETMARHGVTTPATQHVAWFASAPPHAHRMTPPARSDDLVVLDAGVVAGGYVGELTRTWPVGTSVDAATKELYQRAEHLWSRLFDACRPGARCSDLLSAYEACHEALPVVPVATGLGLGFDVPVVTGQLRTTAGKEILEPDMVLAVVAHVAADHRSVVRKDAVLVTSTGPEVLSGAPHWPA